MAKVFATASSRQFTATAAPITALPCTLACWVRNTGSGNRTAFSLDTAAGSARVHIGVNSSDQAVATQSNSAGTTVNASLTSPTMTASTWYLLAGVFTSDTLRDVYLGTSTATNTTSNTFTAPDTVRLGARVNGGVVGNYYDGRIEHAAVWNVALTAAEIEQLANGASPLLVRPNALVFYAPLITTATDASDWVGGLTLTAAGSPTDADGPPLVSLLSVAEPLRVVSVAAPAPAITSIDNANTIINGTGVTITGTNLGSATAVTLKQTGAADQSLFSLVTANTSTSITLSAPNIQNTTIGYGSATLTVTTAAGESSPLSITVSPESGIQYVTLSGHVSGDGWAADLASADGDQLTAPETVSSSTVVLDADGNISFTPELASSTLVARQWYDASTDTWYEDEVQVDGGSDDDFFLFRRHRYLAAQRLVVGRIT